MTSILYSSIFDVLPRIANNHPPLQNGGTLGHNPVPLIALSPIYNVLTPLYLHKYSAVYGHSTIDAFYHIFMNCPTISFIHTLHFHNFSHDYENEHDSYNMNSKFIPKLIRDRHCNRLRELDWKTYEGKLDDETLQLIAKNIPTLEVLKLDFGGDKTNYSSDTLISCLNHQNLPYLKELALWCLDSSTTSPTWVEALSQLTKLRSLHLGSCTFCQDSSDLDRLFSNLSRLEELIITNQIPRGPLREEIPESEKVDGYLLKRFQAAIFENLNELKKFTWSLTPTLRLNHHSSSNAAATNVKDPFGTPFQQASFLMSVMIRYRKTLERIECNSFQHDLDVVFKPENANWSPFREFIDVSGSRQSRPLQIKNLEFSKLKTVWFPSIQSKSKEDKEANAETEHFTTFSFGFILGTCCPILEELYLGNTSNKCIRDLVLSAVEVEKVTGKPSLLSTLKDVSLQNCASSGAPMMRTDFDIESLETLKIFKHLRVLENFRCRVPNCFMSANQPDGENRNDLHLFLNEIAETWRERDQNSLKCVDITAVPHTSVQTTTAAQQQSAMTEKTLVVNEDEQEVDDGETYKHVFHLMEAISNLSNRLEEVRINAGLGKKLSRNISAESSTTTTNIPGRRPSCLSPLLKLKNSLKTFDFSANLNPFGFIAEDSDIEAIAQLERLDRLELVVKAHRISDFPVWEQLVNLHSLTFIDVRADLRKKDPIAEFVKFFGEKLVGRLPSVVEASLSMRFLKMTHKESRALALEYGKKGIEFSV